MLIQDLKQVMSSCHHVIILTLTRGVDPGLGAGPAHSVRHLLAAHVLALHHDGGRQRGVSEPPENRIVYLEFNPFSEEAFIKIFRILEFRSQSDLWRHLHQWPDI